jgi:hypothetical protein
VPTVPERMRLRHLPGQELSRCIRRGHVWRHLGGDSAAGLAATGALRPIESRIPLISGSASSLTRAGADPFAGRADTSCRLLSSWGDDRRSFPIKAATYDPSTSTVTLTLKKPAKWSVLYALQDAPELAGHELADLQGHALEEPVGATGTFSVSLNPRSRLPLPGGSMVFAFTVNSFRSDTTRAPGSASPPYS